MGKPTEEALPHSEECERAVLGAILLDPTLIDHIGGQLSISDFFFPKHRLIYEAFLGVAARDLAIDYRTVEDQLRRKPGSFEEAGGISYLSELDLALPDLGRIDTYVEIVFDKARRRRMIDGARRVIAAAGNGMTTQAVLDLAEAEARAAAADSFAGTEKPPEMADAIMDWLEVVSTRKQAARRPGATTRTGLDNLLGEFQPGCLYLIAGDPGTGKSAMAVQILEDCILRKAPCLFFSNEMKPEATFARWLGHRFLVDSRLIARGETEITPAMIRALQDLKKSGKHTVVNRAGRPWRALASEIRELKKERGIEVVLLDHYHLPGLWPTRRDASPHEAIHELTHAMAQDAITQDVALIAFGQLNRSADKEQRPPRLSDLLYGGEKPAHGVAFLWRPPIGKKEGTGETVRGDTGRFILAKHRDGPEGSIAVIYDGKTSRWLTDPNQEGSW